MSSRLNGNGLRIALIHNLKPPTKDPDLPADHYSECDSPKTVEAIAQALRSGGHTVFPVEANRDLPRRLHKNPIHLAFNIAEGFQGESREARVPALLDLMEIPYTGSGVLALALALDKARSKQLFRAAGIPTPNFQLFSDPKEPLDRRLQIPWMVKPNREGSAKGIWASSVVRDEAALRAQIQRVFRGYSQEVLVEEYIEGTELTVGILGPDGILPVLEIDFSDCRASGESFYSWRMKEFQGNQQLNLTPRFWCPARLNPTVTQAVQGVALKAAKAVGFRDLARVDIRLSADGIPYVLEVNPLPGLDPEESNLPLMARAGGVSYEALIHRLVQMAMARLPSSIPLSKKILPSAKVPRRRALPDLRKQPSGFPGDPVAAVRQGSGRRPDRNVKEAPPGGGTLLDENVKEDTLGR